MMRPLSRSPCFIHAGRYALWGGLLVKMNTVTTLLLFGFLKHNIMLTLEIAIMATVDRQHVFSWNYLNVHSRSFTQAGFHKNGKTL